MKKIAIILMIVGGMFTYFNGYAGTVICKGSGVKCDVKVTIDGVTYEVNSEKDKGSGAVIIE